MTVELSRIALAFLISLFAIYGSAALRAPQSDEDEDEDDLMNHW